MARDHVVLVPGFGGFHALGSLCYYEESVLQQLMKASQGWCVHFFPNLPTAAVSTRAHALREWIEKRQDRGTIQEDDRLHLIAHSTGALDVRHYLASAPRSQIVSFQSISGPHRGSMLARRLGGAGKGLARGAAPWVPRLFCLRRLPPRALLRGATLLRCCVQPADLVDAALDSALEAGTCSRDGWKRAQARDALHDILRWADDLCQDEHALGDLVPGRPSGGWNVGDACCYKNAKTFPRVRSIVTGTPTGEGSPLFRVMHGLNHCHPSPALLPRGVSAPVTLQPLLPGKPSPPLHLGTNDGVVSSVSMIWPDLERSFYLEADHADVLGHYARAQARQRSCEPGGHAYDLLRSRARFSQDEFEALWTSVADYITQANQALAPPSPPASGHGGQDTKSS